MKYWEECLSSSFEEHGIKASEEQIKAIANDVECAHENYGLAFHVPENPLIRELEDTKEKLRKEKDKKMCQSCNGMGYTTFRFGSRSGSSKCDKCGGEGKY